MQHRCRSADSGVCGYRNAAGRRNSVQVRDEHGGVIVGARATLTDSAGREAPAVTDQEGKLLFSDRSPGAYVLEIAASHFKTYQNRVQVTAGQDVALNVTLLVAGIGETIA